MEKVPSLKATHIMHTGFIHPLYERDMWHYIVHFYVVIPQSAFLCGRLPSLLMHLEVCFISLDKVSRRDCDKVTVLIGLRIYDVGLNRLIKGQFSFIILLIHPWEKELSPKYPTPSILLSKVTAMALWFSSHTTNNTFDLIVYLPGILSHELFCSRFISRNEHTYWCAPQSQNNIRESEGIAIPCMVTGQQLSTINPV
jgi:hypothetical protein